MKPGKTPAEQREFNAKRNQKSSVTVGTPRGSFIEQNTLKQTGGALERAQDMVPAVGQKKQTFKEAFRAARNAGKKTFMWEGKSYHTRTKEDMETNKPHKNTKELDPDRRDMSEQDWRDYRKDSGMYQDGGFLSPPIPRLFED
jgi:hypothetical protein